MVTNNDVLQLIEDQKRNWPDYAKRIEQLDRLKIKEFDFGQYKILAQFNEDRAISSGAKTDSKSIANRKCFLCKENRPKVQIGLPLNERFTLLVNPFPILKNHLTIPYNSHEPQNIVKVINDFLIFSKSLDDFILFYNGPKCGASAPDHLHFQAIKKNQLPFENEYKSCRQHSLVNDNEGIIYSIDNFGRKCIIIESKKMEVMVTFFNQIIQQLKTSEEEPKINLFGSYDKETFKLFLFPRKVHRPSQFYEEGDKYMMVSPGAIDMGGVLVLPRECDFNKIDSNFITNIYKQVSL